MTSNSNTPLASQIDHTLLEQGAPQDFVVNFAKDAVRFGFRTACVRAERIPWILETLQNTDVRPCAAVGYRLLVVKPTRDHYRSEEMMPRYNIELEEKKAEITAVMDALDAKKMSSPVEFDITFNIFRLLRGEPSYVEKEAQTLVTFCRTLGRERNRAVVVKLLAENYLLQPDRRFHVWEAIRSAGADFVITSSDYLPAGVSIEEVREMRGRLGPSIGIKAAGGVSQFNYQSFLDAGATRIGSSMGVEIMDFSDR